jgi:glutamate racemase
MPQDLSGKKLGIIHAAVFTAQTVKKYIDEILPEVEIFHAGDDSIQAANLKAGPGVIPKINYFKFITLAHFLQDAGVDLIMLGCSTFNSAVDVARPVIDVPLLQIDRPMMDLAVQQGNRVGLLATLPTTVPSSEKLLRSAAKDAGKEITITTVLAEEAFEVLMAGDQEKHNEMLLEEIDKLSRSVDCVVMAQVSMSVLESSLMNTRVPVYNSGRTGFTKARQILEAQPKHLT